MGNEFKEGYICAINNLLELCIDRRNKIMNENGLKSFEDERYNELTEIIDWLRKKLRTSQ